MPSFRIFDLRAQWVVLTYGVVLGYRPDGRCIGWLSLVSTPRVRRVRVSQQPAGTVCPCSRTVCNPARLEVFGNHSTLPDDELANRHVTVLDLTSSHPLPTPSAAQPIESGCHGHKYQCREKRHNDDGWPQIHRGNPDALGRYPAESRSCFDGPSSWQRGRALVAPVRLGRFTLVPGNAHL